MGFRRIIAASVTLALLLIALTVAFAYSLLGAGASARFWVDHTHRVIEQNQSLLALVQRTENSVRSYLLNRDERYIPTYRSAQALIPPAEARLAALVADSPRQQTRVRALNEAIDDRQSLLERSVALARAGDFEAARALLAPAPGQGLSAGVRERTEAVRATEQALLQRRVRDAAETSTMTLLIGLAVAALALLGLTGLLVDLARVNRRLNAALADAARANAEREASDALNRAVFANSPDYLLVIEVEGDDRFVVSEINPAFERALGVPASTVRGKSLSELAPKDIADRMNALCRRVCGSEGPVLTRDRLPGAPGGPLTWESILAPVRNAEGVASRIVGSIRDITSRVRMEERLREAQRMEAVGQLTGGVAHDFNNLLQVIRGNLELLEPLVSESEIGRRRLAHAVHGADRAAQLTRQLLAFARRQPLAPQVINLSRLVGDMAELLRRTLGEAIEVETVIGGGLWNTLADPAQVESAILNLALNARDAMRSGGRLTVEVTNASLDEAYAHEIDGVTPGQYVMIAVSDTGEGMSRETRKRVFEPFFTTKTDGKGSGLGLSMVYGFVRQSNGHVRIYSEVGLGTTVKLYLPRSRDAVARPAATPVMPSGGSQQTILVVEDDANVRAAAVALLDTLGYQCLEAEDAASALCVIETGAHVDLVFSDVVMPGELKTRDFAERLRATSPGLPILFTSGYTENAIVHHGRLDDGVTLLSKPYSRNELARKIAQLLTTSDEDGV